MFTVFSYLKGFGKLFISLVFRRLELNFAPALLKSDLPKLNSQYKRELIHLFNNMFSQMNSVNNSYEDLKRLNIIRLYLIRTYRGWCHALGKPVRGQRTWSNGWSSYKYNKTLRKFILETTRKMASTKKIEKINYRLVRKKYATKEKKKTTSVKKKNVWF